MVACLKILRKEIYWKSTFDTLNLKNAIQISKFQKYSKKFLKMLLIVAVTCFKIFSFSLKKINNVFFLNLKWKLNWITENTYFKETFSQYQQVSSKSFQLMKLFFFFSSHKNWRRKETKWNESQEKLCSTNKTDHLRHKIYWVSKCKWIFFSSFFGFLFAFILQWLFQVGKTPLRTWEQCDNIGLGMISTGEDCRQQLLYIHIWDNKGW